MTIGATTSLLEFATSPRHALVHRVPGRTIASRQCDDVAKRLGVGQDAVSRYEQRTDMLLSTLQSYVRAMGGELSLTATFPKGRAVKILNLSEIE